MAERGVPRWGPGGRGPVLALLLALPVLTACGLVPREPELVKRWDRYAVADTTGLVRVTVFTARSPASDAPSALSELSRSAQATYVRAMADRTSTAAELRASLAAPIAVPGEPVGQVDRTVFRRRLVISIERTGPAGGREREDLSRVARVARTRIAMGLPDGRARFTTWDRFATRWDTVELGTMTLSRSAELEGDLAPLPGPRIEGAGDVGLSASLGAKLDESLSLRERPLSSGILHPDSMILLQVGTAGFDLVGNSAVEVELRLADRATATSHLHRFGALFDSAGRPSPSREVRIERRRHVHPSRSAVAAGGITAGLRHETLIRAIRRRRGDDTYAEGDDGVVLLRDTARGAPTVELVPEREMRVSAWTIARSAGGAREVLQVGAPAGAGPGATPRELRFATAREARALLRWLHADRRRAAPETARSAAAGSGDADDPALSVAGRPLYLAPGRPLRRSEVTGLALRLRPLNWTP